MDGAERGLWEGNYVIYLIMSPENRVTFFFITSTSLTGCQVSWSVITLSSLERHGIHIKMFIPNACNHFFQLLRDALETQRAGYQIIRSGNWSPSPHLASPHRLLCDSLVIILANSLMSFARRPIETRECTSTLEGFWWISVINIMLNLNFSVYEWWRIWRIITHISQNRQWCSRNSSIHMM